MVKFNTDYVFETADGPANLVELFEGRWQLVVYQVMDLGPDNYCSGGSAYTDNTDTGAGRVDLRRRETSYLTISDMPLAQIQAYKQTKGWTVPFYSSRDTTFSDDCGAGHGFGLSVFLRDGSSVYRTYFTNGRGVDRLRFDVNIFDLTPLGRQEEWEETPDGWLRTEPRFALTRKAGPDEPA